MQKTKPPARPGQRHCPVDQRGLQRDQRLQVARRLHEGQVRVPADRPGCRTGRVEQDRVERRGLPLPAHRPPPPRLGAGAAEFSANRPSRSSETSSAVTLAPAAASCRVFPPGAAQRSSTRSPGCAASTFAGQRRRGVLEPRIARVIARQRRELPAGGQPHRPGRQHLAPRRFGQRRRIAARGQVHRRDTRMHRLDRRGDLAAIGRLQPPAQPARQALRRQARPARRAFGGDLSQDGIGKARQVRGLRSSPISVTAAPTTPCGAAPSAQISTVASRSTCRARPSGVFLRNGFRIASAGSACRRTLRASRCARARSSGARPASGPSGASVSAESRRRPRPRRTSARPPARRAASPPRCPGP